MHKARRNLSEVPFGFHDGGRAMRRYWRKRWLVLAVMTVGTAMQLSTCRQEVALFGLRTAFTSVTLPVNTFIRQALLGL
jgi:hypothetical protein